MREAPKYLSPADFAAYFGVTAPLHRRRAEVIGGSYAA